MCSFMYLPRQLKYRAVTSPKGYFVLFIITLTYLLPFSVFLFRSTRNHWSIFHFYNFVILRILHKLNHTVYKVLIQIIPLRVIWSVLHTIIYHFFLMINILWCIYIYVLCILIIRSYKAYLFTKFVVIFILANCIMEENHQNIKYKEMSFM